MGAPDPRDRTDLAQTLRELAWAIHRTAPARAGIGPIPTTEIALLKQIVDAPGSTVNELAVALGLRQPNVSAAIRTLVSRGWAVKQPAVDDRRVTRVSPTPRGIREHTEISAAWREPVQAAIAALDPVARSELAAVSDHLQEVLRRLQDPDGVP